MAVSLRAAAGRQPLLIVALLVERTVRDPSSGFTRAFRGLLVCRLIGDVLRFAGIAGRLAADDRCAGALAVVPDLLVIAKLWYRIAAVAARVFRLPTVLWHVMTLRGTVAKAMPVPAIEFRDVSFARPGGL